jgi:serine/threonine protein kinase
MQSQISNPQTFPSLSQVSKQAKRFIATMLQVNPKTRLSASSLLKRRWMCDPDNNSRLHQVYDDMGFGADGNDDNLTEDVERTMENIVIHDDDEVEVIENPNPAKRPRLMG